MSDAFNTKGIYRTIALTGEDSQEKREDAIARLAGTGDYEVLRRDEQLDYIFTVDIFNEGVDIPEVNQVIMLRQTESPIVFIQQLGRGLRKFEDKEYVVILDFIGNYSNSYMIPLALSGDRSYNKDTLRKYVQSGNRIIPGKSTHHFLIKIKEKDYQVNFDAMQEQMLHYISQKLANGMRVRDLLALQFLLNGSEAILFDVEQELKSKYNHVLSELGKVNLVNILMNEFAVSGDAIKFKDCLFIKMNGSDYAISDEFKKALINEDFKNHIQQLIDFGVDRYKDMYMGVKLDNNPFALYEKYNYEQVCQLLEWPKNQIAQNIGGYKFDEATKTYPVFINYHKGDDVQDSIKYEDRFESQTLIKAISKNNRYLRSKDVNTAINADSLGVSMHLFVRKNKDDKESKEFYYLGPIHSTGKENARLIGYQQILM